MPKKKNIVSRRRAVVGSAVMQALEPRQMLVSVNPAPLPDPVSNTPDGHLHLENLPPMLVYGFDGLTNSMPHILPNGNFEAILVSDRIGTETEQLDGDYDGIPGGDFVEPFFFLSADANHDRSVDVNDYGQIDFNASTGFQLTGYSNGDFNYSGSVDVDDYGIIDLTYGTTLPPIPTQPNTLEVTASTGLNQITLTFQEPEWAFDGFGVWRSTDDINFELIAQLYNGNPELIISEEEGIFSWTDTGLEDGTKYTYRERPFTIEGGYTHTSNKTSAATVMLAPGPVTQTLLSDDGVTLHWTDNSNNPDNEDHFIIEQLQSNGTTWSEVAIADADATSATVTSLWSLTDYTFRVRAAATNGATSGGGGGASTPDSPPSDPTTALTDYGDGIVYDGSPTNTPGEEETFDGVSGSWSGGPANPAELALNHTYTLTLSGLPDHYALWIDASGIAGNTAGTTGDTDQVEMSFQSASDVYVAPPMQPDFISTVEADHTDSTATITFTGSAWETDDAGWGLLEVRVRVLRYRVGAGSETLTINKDDEQVQVWAMMDDGTTPAEGVELAVERPNGVEATGGSATTGPDGTTLLDLKGVTLGLATFVLAAQVGGGKAPATAPVGPFIIGVAGLGGGGNTGTTVSVPISVYDANGVLLNTNQTPAPNARVAASSKAGIWIQEIVPDPANATQFLMKVALENAATGKNNNATVILSHPKNPPNVGVTTTGISVTAAVLTIAPPTLSVSAGATGTVTATVTGPGAPWGAGPVANATVNWKCNAAVFGGNGNAFANGSGTTNAAGTVTFTVGPFANPQTGSIRFWIGDGTDPTNRIVVPIEVVP